MLSYSSLAIVAELTDPFHRGDRLGILRPLGILDLHQSQEPLVRRLHVFRRGYPMAPA